MKAPLKMLRTAQVLERTGLSHRLLYSLMDTGKFPRPVKLSTQLVAWPEQEIESWLQAKIDERDGKAA